MFFEEKIRNAIRVSNSLDKDQARHFVGPDLGSNCLQLLSADDKSRERVRDHSPVIKPIVVMGVTLGTAYPE